MQVWVDSYTTYQAQPLLSRTMTMILTTPSPLPLYQIFPFSRPKSASSKSTLPVAAQQETSRISHYATRTGLFSQPKLG